MPARLGTEPRIVLANRSAYRVSYWVAQEDKKKRTTARHQQQQQIVTSINQHLNVGHPGTASGLSSEAKRTTTSKESPAAVEADEAVYFLTRDHRMGPMGNTQATKIPFPVDCQDMRVYAFFELDGRWRLYEDKVYSIGLFKKVFNHTSFDGNITPHIDQAASETTAAAVPVRGDVRDRIISVSYTHLTLPTKRIV